MEKYELVNPSDKILFEAKDDKIAFVSCLCLGNGYAAKRVDNEQIAVGFYLFGIDEAEFEKQLGLNMNDFLEKNKNDIAESLATFRLFYKERSSMNDIVGYAHKLSKVMAGE